MIEKLCKLRDIQHAINHYEVEFLKLHGICLNEGMMLCSLTKSDCLSSGELGELAGLTTSNTSKVISSLEKKGFIKRVLGKTDKRQMYFHITAKGKECMDGIGCDNIKLPKILDDILI